MNEWVATTEQLRKPPIALPAVIYKRDRERYLRAMRRAAAVRGRLRAVRGDDGRWRSSCKWVEQYEATKGSHIAKNRSARS